MKTIIKKCSLIVMICLLCAGIFSSHTSHTNAASNRAKIYSTLRSLGYSKAGAAGIMSNIKYESSYNPRSGGVCYGLVQWTGGRKANLRRYCARHGLSASSIKGQVKFLDHELKTSYRGVYRSIKGAGNSASGAYRAAYKFCYDFERPAARSSASARRASYAHSLYRTL